MYKFCRHSNTRCKSDAQQFWRHELTFFLQHELLFATAGPHKSGTVCCPISDYAGCHTASSGGYWRHFYLDSEATAQCELSISAPNRNILIYKQHSTQKMTVWSLVEAANLLWYRKCTNTDTYDGILTQIVVRSPSNCIQMHQILKIADLSMNPFLHTAFVTMTSIKILLQFT